MALKKVAGSKIYIGRRVSYKDTTTAGDYAGATWTEIAGWTEVGELNVDVEVLTQMLVSSGITQYGKGVMSFPTMTNRFTPIAADAGQLKYTQAVLSCNPYEFKIEWSADCAEVSAVTMTIAAPAVITWTGHVLVAGAPVVLSTTGALPTGLVAGTTYYVAASPAPAANTFSLAATPGGAAITTTGAQSGVHTAVSQPIGETDLFYGLALGSGKSGGDANAIRNRTLNIQPICRSVEI